MGNRVAKKSVPQNAPNDVTTTYYFREASGNVMSVYKRESSSTFSPREYHIYGSDRMGMLTLNPDDLNTNPNVIPAQAGISYGNGFLGRKQYELKDHLGNVHLVLSDRIETTTFDNAVAGYEYYPFGMALQSFESDAYRYGFNGMEKDDDWNGNGNSYDFGARIYDSRLGRWMSMDAMMKLYPMDSPYTFSGNSPLIMIDSDGNEKILIHYEIHDGGQIIVKATYDPSNFAYRIGKESDQFTGAPEYVVKPQDIYEAVIIDKRNGADKELAREIKYIDSKKSYIGALFKGKDGNQNSGINFTSEFGTGTPTSSAILGAVETREVGDLLIALGAGIGASSNLGQKQSGSGGSLKDFLKDGHLTEIINDVANIWNEVHAPEPEEVIEEKFKKSLHKDNYPVRQDTKFKGNETNSEPIHGTDLVIRHGEDGDGKAIKDTVDNSTYWDKERDRSNDK